MIDLLCSFDNSGEGILSDVIKSLLFRAVTLLVFLILLSPEMSVESRIFAVTGGASGMGAATRRLLAGRGARAACAADIPPKGFDSLKKSIAKINLKTEIY